MLQIAGDALADNQDDKDCEQNYAQRILLQPTFHAVVPWLLHLSVNKFY
jgi:hypothetical protein